MTRPRRNTRAIAGAIAGVVVALGAVASFAENLDHEKGTVSVPVPPELPPEPILEWTPPGTVLFGWFVDGW